jgi:transcription elongation factor Elf1
MTLSQNYEIIYGYFAQSYPVGAGLAPAQNNPFFKYEERKMKSLGKSVDEFLKLLKSRSRTTTDAPPPKPLPPAEYCPECGSILQKSYQDNGVHCRECGRYLNRYTPRVITEAKGRSSVNNFPLTHIFECPCCLRKSYSDIEYTNKSLMKSVMKCHFCAAELHPPKGFCIVCWQELSNHGTCMNNKCGRYQI